MKTTQQTKIKILRINNNLENKEKDTLQSLSNQSIEEIKSEFE